MQPETALKLCAAVEILIVAVSVLLAVWKRNNLKSVIRTLGVGVFLSLVVMALPYYFGGRSPYAFWLSVFNAMCAMLMNANPVEILESIGAVQVSFVSVYRAVLLFLFILLRCLRSALRCPSSRSGSQGCSTDFVRYFGIPIYSRL